GMVAVVKPGPVIQFSVSTHAPGNRLVGIAAVMPVIAVEIREAMAEIPKRQKETDVMPVQNTEDHKRRDEAWQLEHSPKCLARVLAFQFLKNSFRVFAKETDECVLQWMLGFAVVSVLVDGNPIDGLTLFIGPVGISLVMLHVNALVKDLAEANR